MRVVNYHRKRLPAFDALRAAVNLCYMLQRVLHILHGEPERLAECERRKTVFEIKLAGQGDSKELAAPDETHVFVVGVVGLGVVEREGRLTLDLRVQKLLSVCIVKIGDNSARAL